VPRARYHAILFRFWKNSLIRDMSFRANFLINAASELGWVVMVLIFLKIIFMNTAQVRGWTEHQYLFLAGTHMIITSIFEAVLFANCWRFSELVRSGDLDFVLLKPVNTQFLVSFERVNYSAFANLPVGIGLCVYAASGVGRPVSPSTVVLYVCLVLLGVVILYALLFLFAITSIWLIRQTGLEHLWFYTTSVARYPAEIYKNFLGGTLWFGLVFIVPVLLVVNLPASVVVRSFNGWLVPYMVGMAAALLAISAAALRLSLRWYRSASS